MKEYQQSKKMDGILFYPKSGNVDKRWRWSKNRLEEQKDEVLISGTPQIGNYIKSKDHNLVNYLQKT